MEENILLKNYVCDKPKRIVFGDPLYFEEYENDKKQLKQLTINKNLNTSKYKPFECLVSIRRTNDEGYSFLTMVISLVNMEIKNNIKGLYVSSRKFTSQKVDNEAYGVDTAEYLLAVDDNDDVIMTGADGFWANVSTYTRNINGKKITDAILFEISMPEELDEEDVDQYIHYYFKNLKEVKIDDNYNVIEI